VNFPDEKFSRPCFQKVRFIRVSDRKWLGEHAGAKNSFDDEPPPFGAGLKQVWSWQMT